TGGEALLDERLEPVHPGGGFRTEHDLELAAAREGRLGPPGKLAAVGGRRVAVVGHASRTLATAHPSRKEDRHPMLYVIIGHDAPDGTQKRPAVRPAHLEHLRPLFAAGRGRRGGPSA